MSAAFKHSSRLLTSAISMAVNVIHLQWGNRIVATDDVIRRPQRSKPISFKLFLSDGLPAGDWQQKALIVIKRLEQRTGCCFGSVSFFIEWIFCILVSCSDLFCVFLMEVEKPTFPNSASSSRTSGLFTLYY